MGRLLLIEATQVVIPLWEGKRLPSLPSCKTSKSPKQANFWGYNYAKWQSSRKLLTTLMNRSRMLTKAMQVGVLFVATFVQSPDALEAADDRQEVNLPPMMREHMLRNMRDHLMALQEITRCLSESQFDRAAEIAEGRLGLSSLESHGASHMSQFLPQEMGQIGMNMHRAASRFSIAAKDAELEDGPTKALSALSEVIQQCVACHAGYKVQ